MFKRICIIFFAFIILVLMLYGCTEPVIISTAIGDFDMQSEAVNSFSGYVPDANYEFLLIKLTPVLTDMTIDKLSDYFKPSETNPGPSIVVDGAEYEISYLAYSDSTPPACVLIYQVPLGASDLDQISLRLP